VNSFRGGIWRPLFPAESPQDDFLILWLGGKAKFASDNAWSAFRFTPESVDIHHIGPQTRDGDFEKAFALRRLVKNPLFLGESVADAATADFRTSRETATESLNIVFLRTGHEGK
jgi:hypothetical protein